MSDIVDDDHEDDGDHVQDMSSRCDGCGNGFLAGTKKIEYKGHQWHENCFHCKVCATKVSFFTFVYNG